jgi:hypothetical protein
LLHCMSPLLAQSRHKTASAVRSLLGWKADIIGSL